MITKVDNIQSVGIGFKYPTEFFGLSTDTKPTDTANGSLFTEIDSGKKYMFDFAGSQWYEMPAAESGGGGGGGSGGGVLVVHDVDGTLDKTWQEIHDSIAGGVPVFIFTDSTDMYKPQCMPAMYVNQDGLLYQVYGMYFDVDNDWLVSGLAYATESADGYPAYL